ncbi:MAG: hypothetical protein ACREJ2_00590 [Planctomycetota bacterium]
MSRVLNVSIEELRAAKLPPICAASGRPGTPDQIPATDLTLYKLDPLWFIAAVFLGPLCFVLVERALTRRTVRLPIDPALAAEHEQRCRWSLRWLHVGYLALLMLPAVFGVLFSGFHGPPLSYRLAELVGGLSVIPWIVGAFGVWRLCTETRRLPVLSATFDATRVAIELPNWWVADEYRRALGHALQGQPKNENQQAEEDAVWEAHGQRGTWDSARPTDPPAPPSPPPPPPPDAAAAAPPAAPAPSGSNNPIAGLTPQPPQPTSESLHSDHDNS